MYDRDNFWGISYGIYDEQSNAEVGFPSHQCSKLASVGQTSPRGTNLASHFYWTRIQVWMFILCL
jgi:hypothetical protein